LKTPYFSEVNDKPPIPETQGLTEVILGLMQLIQEAAIQAKETEKEYKSNIEKLTLHIQEKDVRIKELVDKISKLTPSDPNIFHCPGHPNFLHRYTKGNKKKLAMESAEAIALKEKQPNIKSATYKAIDKDTTEGVESAYFRYANGFLFKFGALMTYYHDDDYKGCPDYPTI